MHYPTNNTPTLESVYREIRTDWQRMNAEQRADTLPHIETFLRRHANVTITRDNAGLTTRYVAFDDGSVDLEILDVNNQPIQPLQG